jgi:hypothetical protein
MPDFNHNFLGRQSLQYLGNRAATPPNFIKLNRDPTTQDFKEFVVGDLWLNTTSNGLWYLANLTGSVATWVQITGGAAALDTLTGDTGGAVPPDMSDNINILGGTGIQVNGNPATNTLTIEGIDPIATQYDADSGSATPNSGVVNLVGGNNISTSATGNTVTFSTINPETPLGKINVDDNVAPGTNPVVADSAGEITIAGDVVNNNSTPIQTISRAANAFDIEVQSATTVTGAPGNKLASGLAQFESTEFNVNSDGYVSLVGGGTATSSLFNVFLNSTISNVTGDGTGYLIIFDNEEFDLNNDYNIATGRFTAPFDGYYQFNSSVGFSGLTSSHTTGKLQFLIGGTEVQGVVRGNFFSMSDAGNNLALNISTFLNLSAGDQVGVFTEVTGGPKTVDILRFTGLITSFSGFIIRKD